MKNRFFNDAIVTGFALFAMFFGAGNLIFPAFLGNAMGDQFLPSLLGFLVTGVGLPLLGVLACAKAEGSYEVIATRIGPTFAKISTAVIILAIGPLIAIPRSASTTYELGVVTLLPNASALITTLVFFALCLFFVLRPTSVVDTIGKFLTPGLLIILIVMIVKGLFMPIGEVAELGVTGALGSSLKEGYQTLDALAAMIFGAIILTSIKSKGYTDHKSISKMILISGVIAAVGLAVIYGGLMYLGAQTSSLEVVEFSRTQLLMYVTKEVFGSLGAVLLSIVTILACLTTAVALLTASAEFFTTLFKNRIPYSVHAIIITVISILMATNDVDSIVALAGPALDIIYPVVIVVIVLTIMGKLVKSNTVMSWTVYVTLAFSLLVTLVPLFGLTSFENVLTYLPFYGDGFGWLIPTVITFIVASLFDKKA